MKDQQNDRSNQSTDSKSSTKPTQDNHKKETVPVTGANSKDKQNGLQQDHEQSKSYTTSQTIKMSDRTEVEHDVKAKDKTPGAKDLHKEWDTEKSKTK